MRFGDDYFSRMEPASQKAMAAMRELEAGAIVNPDEKRQVGHYWLRDAALAPTEELRATISKDLSDIKAFASGSARRRDQGGGRRAVQERAGGGHRRIGVGAAVGGGFAGLDPRPADTLLSR